MTISIDRAARAAREAAEKCDPLFQTIYDSEFEAIAQAVLRSLIPPDEGVVEAMQAAFFEVGEAWPTVLGTAFTTAINHMIEGEGAR